MSQPQRFSPETKLDLVIRSYAASIIRGDGDRKRVAAARGVCLIGTEAAGTCKGLLDSQKQWCPAEDALVGQASLNEISLRNETGDGVK